MRFAAIGDVQGNGVALRAVLQDLQSRHDNIERVVATGDLVGRGPEPNEVIQILRDGQIESVRGNYDDALAFERMSSGHDFPDSRSEAADADALTWTRSVLTPENMAFVHGLPREMRLSPQLRGIQVERVRDDARTREYRRNYFMRALFGGLARENRRSLTKTLRVLVLHGSPRALNEFIREQTAKSLLQAICRDADADVLVTGHAGESFQRELDGVTFVGVGSVSGIPESGPVARYVIVDVRDTVSTEFYEVPYDPESHLQALRQSGLPQDFTVPFLG